MFWGTIGLFLTYRLCREYADSNSSTAALIGIWFATPVVFYLYITPPMAHANSLFAVSLFLFVWIQTRDDRQLWEWGILGASAGLMVLVRELNWLVLLAPAVGELGEAWDVYRVARVESALDSRGLFASWWHRFRSRAAGYVVAAVPMLLLVTPQLVSYRMLHGTFGPTPFIVDKFQSLPIHAGEVLFSELSRSVLLVPDHPDRGDRAAGVVGGSQWASGAGVGGGVRSPGADHRVVRHVVGRGIVRRPSFHQLHADLRHRPGRPTHRPAIASLSGRGRRHRGSDRVEPRPGGAVQHRVDSTRPAGGNEHDRSQPVPRGTSPPRRDRLAIHYRPLVVLPNPIMTPSAPADPVDVGSVSGVEGAAIWLVTDVYPPGCFGSGWSTHALARTLDHRGHTVEVISIDPGASGVSQRVFDGIRVVEVGVRSARRNPLRRLGARDYAHHHMKRYLERAPADRLRCSHPARATPAQRGTDGGRGSAPRSRLGADSARLLACLPARHFLVARHGVQWLHDRQPGRLHE